MTSTEQLPAPLTVAELAQLARRDGVEAALRVTGPWMFVGPPPEEDEDDWRFRTVSARSLPIPVGETKLMVREDHPVFGAVKARAGAFATTLLVGRSTSNDICLRHGSISKLHARIRVVSDAEYWLSDAGSSNGTRLDDEPLGEGVERRLHDGALVRFGALTLHCFDSRAFLSRLAAMFSPGG